VTAEEEKARKEMGGTRLDLPEADDDVWKLR
jgi:hypothetical protein